jgi:hypothetical protein
LRVSHGSLHRLPFPTGSGTHPGWTEARQQHSGLGEIVRSSRDEQCPRCRSWTREARPDTCCKAGFGRGMRAVAVNRRRPLLSSRKASRAIFGCARARRPPPPRSGTG